MFWKMTVIEQKTPMTAGKVIGESVWLPVPAAIQRLTHPQEKLLISRLGSSPAKVATVPVETPVEPPIVMQKAHPASLPKPLAAPLPKPQAAPLPPPIVVRKRASIEDERVRDRLLRESEAFRVELVFLERRSNGDKSWATAAHEQLDNVLRCLETNDIEGGLFGLHAAQRFAVHGLNKGELITRAYILREEALKISSSNWRGEAMDNLLAVADDQLTADRLVDAMKLRDEESSNQHYRTRLTGDHLRIMLLSGQIRLLGPVLLFGLIGSCFGTAQSLMRGKGDSMIPNVFVMLTPVIFGGIAALAAFGIHEYLSGLYGFTHTHWGGLLAMAFLFGLLGQRLLARFTGGKRRKKARA
jgi:hypothetical protein